MDAVEDTKRVSEFISTNELLQVWAPLRYQVHCEKMGMPTLPELRQAMKELPDTAYNHARLHVIGEWRVEEGARITLKYSTTVNDKIATKNLGSCCFRNGRCSFRMDTKMPSTSWLYIDMMHLIMLMAYHMEADIVTIKLWHSQAKALLSNMSN